MRKIIGIIIVLMFAVSFVNAEKPTSWTDVDDAVIRIFPNASVQVVQPDGLPATKYVPVVKVTGKAISADGGEVWISTSMAFGQASDEKRTGQQIWSALGSVNLRPAWKALYLEAIDEDVSQ